MAREYLLNSTVTVDGGVGTPKTLTTVRLVGVSDNPINSVLVVYWECGYNNSGWDNASGAHKGEKVYNDESSPTYATLKSITSAGAGENHSNKLEDKIYDDLYSGSSIGLGTPQDFAF